MAHDPRTRVCTTPRCNCTAFAATFSCGCGEPWASHATVVETRDERKAAGRPVDNLLGGGAGYEALGGLTNFASLADGAARLCNARRAALQLPPAYRFVQGTSLLRRAWQRSSSRRLLSCRALRPLWRLQRDCEPRASLQPASSSTEALSQSSKLNALLHARAALRQATAQRRPKSCRHRHRRQGALQRAMPRSAEQPPCTLLSSRPQGGLRRRPPRLKPSPSCLSLSSYIGSAWHATALQSTDYQTIQPIASSQPCSAALLLVTAETKRHGACARFSWHRCFVQNRSQAESPGKHPQVARTAAEKTAKASPTAQEEALNT